MQPKKIALLVKALMEDKKAEKPVILDISKQTTITHYFVITHGNSGPHVKAITQHVMDTMKERGVVTWNVEGLESMEWVIVDLGSVIAHIFYREVRDHYALERLWGHARKLR